MEKPQKTYLAIFGVILAVGLMASAFILGHQFKNFRQTGVITVKGLAEANHQATQGTWRVIAGGWGETYANALKDNQQQLNIAVNFLEKQGFKPEEREIRPIEVSPYMEEYYDEKGERRERQNGYQSTRVIVISSKNLAALEQAVANIQGLRAANQYIDFVAPEYYLENLESIKRELISQATKDAYVRAEEFAKTSNVKVGVLQSASQGSFNIYSAEPGSEESDDSYGGSYSTATIDKRVRLVVTIQYSID